jgi:cytochrome c-type biogenesis protein CcmH
MRRAAVLLGLLAALLVPATAMAAKPSLVDIEDEVMCTSCEIPLNIAESTQADQQRDFIRARIEQGQTKEEIKTALVAEYGRDVLALPESDGFGITAYLVPLGLLALLAAGLALLLPRWRRRAPAAAMGSDEGPALSKVESGRLDEELARYER